MGSDTLGLGIQPDGLINTPPHEAHEPEHVSGIIKWFDVAKGYGFVTADDGGPDILVHVTCLRRDGFQTALEGARVTCEATRGPKGRQAFRVLDVDLSVATPS